MNNSLSVQKQHNIFIYDKTKVTLTGISSVDSFNDSEVSASLCDGSLLCVEGENLSIIELDLEKGSAEINGSDIFAVVYSDRQSSKPSFFKSIFKGGK